jgi:hypothetical protein
LANPELVGALFARQARAAERLAKDMRRYAVKHDGLRRSLASDEEREASKRAVAFLAGRRSIIR